MALQKLVLMVQRRAIPPQQATYWDAAMIHRFLYARDYDVPKGTTLVVCM